MSRLLRSAILALVVVAVATTLVNRNLLAQVVPDPAAPSKPETKAPEYPEIKDAVEKFQVRQFDDALTLLEKAVKKYPDLPPAQVLMFELFARANQPALARNALERAVLADPDEPQAYVILANIALQEGRVTEAELLFQKTNSLLKGFTKSMKRKEAIEKQTIGGIAQVAEAREKWELAETHLNALLALDAKDTVALQRLARAMFKQKTPKVKDAYDKLKEAAKIDSKNVLTPEAALGLLYQQYPDEANAEIWMKKALDKAPKDLRTRLVVARWYLDSGKLTEAKTQAAEAMKIDEKSLEAKLVAGVIALFQKDYKTAEAYFQDVHLQQPDNFASSNNLALALCEQTDADGKPDPVKLRRAMVYAAQNVQQNNRSPEAASTLGWVCYKAKDLDRAEQALRQAASLGNLRPDTAFYLAQVAYDRGNKELAKNLLIETLKNRSFAMKPESEKLLAKIKSEPAPKKDEK